MKKWILLVMLFLLTNITASLAGYIDNGDGTVTDTATELMWEQGTQGNVRWERAGPRCDSLKLANYTDWRLPTKAEIETLVDDSRNPPTIDTSFFPDTESATYWSSTVYPNLSNTVWVARFHLGDISFEFTALSAYVKAVRDLQSEPTDNLPIWYRDYDWDGYGNPDISTKASSQPFGYVSNSSDCNDYDKTIHPGATEIRSDGIDQDCNGLDLASLTTYYRDGDGDGYGNPDDTTESVSRPYGYNERSGDCDDTDSSIHPEATEIRGDGIDQDCNGSDLESLVTYYYDGDSDGYGDPNTSYNSSSKPPEYVASNTDCNDKNQNIHPGATEILNYEDDNCDGIVDNIIPEKVTLTSPSTTMEDTTPTFTWDEDPYSTWYKLFLWDSAEEKIRGQWYDASEICAGGSCSVSLEAELLVDDYEWFVKSWNDHGKVWSDGMAFTVQGDDTPPSKVTHTSPSGQLASSMSTYTWTQDLVSTWYRLWVGYPGDIKVFAQWYEASDICSDGNCSVTTGTELMEGDYEWYIKSWNDYGKIWSDGMEFSVSLSVNTYYLDSDGDGYGDIHSYIETASKPVSYVTDNSDCNDNDSSIHPGALEIVGDNIDQNCDGGDLNAGNRSFTNSIGMTFVELVPGTFIRNGHSQVTLSKSCFIQTTEVTQGQWERIMNDNPSYFNNCSDCPRSSIMERRTGIHQYSELKG
jgi:hypothetical protein